MGLLKTADNSSISNSAADTVSTVADVASSAPGGIDLYAKYMNPKSNSLSLGSLGKMAVPAMAVVAGGYIIKQILDKMKNDVRKTRIIEDIALNDPMLKTVDKRQLYHWYATICYYAPSLANDKLTVTEVLQNFARFGKVDFNTIKMLVDTEKSVSDTAKNRSENLKNMKTLFTPWK